MYFFDIDTQHDFMHGEGALYLPNAETIWSNIERLLRKAGEKKITTISSSCAHEPDDPEFQIFPEHCIEGTPGAERIFPNLPELPRHEIEVGAKADPSAKLEPGTHYLVKKKVFDLFSNLWLDGLRKRGDFRGEKCVVFGVATDFCVRACGLGLAEAGAEVYIVEDAIMGVTPETTEKALREHRVAGVVFTTTDQVLKDLDY
jgi:nicotinamidase/pyrazinamidase